MNTLSKIAAGAASFALVALLSMPIIVDAAGGDGTGPAPGSGGQMMKQEGNVDEPCYGKGQGRGSHKCGHYRNCKGCGPGQGRHHKGCGQGRSGFVDADGDGICDNHPKGCGQCQGRGGFVDADGDGVCDNHPKGRGQGQGRGGFVDADGDGICDNHPSNGKGGGVAAE